MGKKCVQYLKPLLDSGTHGTKGHVQVYVPFLTESYGQAQEVDKKEYPLCTLRHFPSTIQHTIQVEALFFFTPPMSSPALGQSESVSSQVAGARRLQHTGGEHGCGL